MKKSEESFEWEVKQFGSLVEDGDVRLSSFLPPDMGVLAVRPQSLRAPNARGPRAPNCSESCGVTTEALGLAPQGLTC